MKCGSGTRASSIERLRCSTELPIRPHTRVSHRLVLDRDGPCCLHTPRDIIEGVKLDSGSNSRSGRDGSGEAYSVQTIVDGELQPAFEPH